MPRHLLPRSGVVRFCSSAAAPLHMRPSGVPLAIARCHNVPASFRPSACCQTKRHFYHEDAHERLRNAKPLVPNTVAGRLARAGSSRASRAVVVASVVAAVAFYLYNSQTSPVTGRRRFNFLSDALVAQAYSRAAEAIVRQVEEQGGHFLSNWDPRTMLVQRVMKRLIPVSGMEDLDWEVRVIADSRGFSFSLPVKFCLTVRKGC